ncbi:hypothetical protein, partial [Klebsiella pneumoniae]
SCAAPSAKGDDKFITTDYLQQCRLVYSGGSFSAILGSGIASRGIGWILGMAGYIPGNVTTQPIIVLCTLQILFIYVPIILSALSLFLLRLYTLEKIYPSIIKDLSLRTENIY